MLIYKELYFKLQYHMEPIITKYIPKQIIDAFGGEQHILSLPRFEIDNSKYGLFRDYPDFIKYDQVTHPIMIGVDNGNRIFIVFKLKFVQCDKTVNITTVLFQRYTDSGRWTTASNPSGQYAVMGDGLLGSEHYAVLQKLLTERRLNNVRNNITDEIGDYVLG